MPPKTTLLTLAAILLVASVMILIQRARTAPPPVAPGPAIVPDDRSAVDVIQNTATLVQDDQLQTLYQVKKGDTLFRISQQFGVSIGAIKKANQDKSDLLQVGQWLAIPK